jgi:hypothetical protein
MSMKPPPVSIDQYMKGLLGQGAPPQPQQQVQQQQAPQQNVSMALQQEQMKLQQLSNKKAELIQHLQQIDQAIFKQQGALEMLRRFSGQQ